MRNPLIEKSYSLTGTHYVQSYMAPSGRSLHFATLSKERWLEWLAEDALMERAVIEKMERWWTAPQPRLDARAGHFNIDLYRKLQKLRENGS